MQCDTWTPDMLNLFEELTAIVAALDANGIEYALCGGLAMAVHAFPRATVDIDLLIQTKDLDQVKTIAHGLDFRFEAGPMTFHGGDVEIRRVSKIDPVLKDSLVLDLLLVTPAVQAAWTSRQAVAWQNGTLWVVYREPAGRRAMKVDMSSEAVTARLIRTSQLRELCLSLGKSKPTAVRRI